MDLAVRWPSAGIQWWSGLGKNSAAGAAYIFERNTGWGQAKKLTAGDAAADDRFGGSVAISGDTVVVGAWTENSSPGAAYIFKRDTGWGQAKKLTAGDAAAFDYFGLSVAISGDTVVVGAFSNSKVAGAAYLSKQNTAGDRQKS